MPQAYDLATLHLDGSSEVPRLLAQFPEVVPLSFGDGEHLIREDETSQDIFIVLRGALVVEQASGVPGAPPAMLACIMAEPDTPAIVGEMAYLGSQSRAASVRSSGRTHTLRLEPRHIDAILESYPGLTRVLCAQFSRRLQETDQALRALQGRFALAPARRMANAGEVLFTQGDPATSLFQVVMGSILLEGRGGSRTVGPADLPQGLLEAGAYLAGGLQGCTATVQDAAMLVVIDGAHREAVVRCFPEVALGCMD